MPTDVASQHLATAALAGREMTGVRHLWAHAFSRIGDELDRPYGLRHEHLAAIAHKNYSNARRSSRGSYSASESLAK